MKTHAAQHDYKHGNMAFSGCSFRESLLDCWLALLVLAMSGSEIVKMISRAS